MGCQSTNILDIDGLGYKSLGFGKKWILESYKLCKLDCKCTYSFYKFDWIFFRKFRNHLNSDPCIFIKRSCLILRETTSNHTKKKKKYHNITHKGTTTHHLLVDKPKTNASSFCLRRLTTLSCGRSKPPKNTRHHWLPPRRPRPSYRQQLQLMHHEHHRLSRSHFKTQPDSVEELTCHRCQAHRTDDRAASTSYKVLRRSPLWEEASQDRRLAQDA